MTYLVDGSVLCEPTKPNPHAGAVAWLQALAHGLTVATRNRRDFAKAGVKLVNPFV